MSAAGRRSGAKVSTYSERSSAAIRNGKLSAASRSCGVKRTLTVPIGNSGLPNSRHMRNSQGPASSATAAAPPAA